MTNLLVTAITSLGMLLLGGMVFGFHASGEVWQALLPILPMMLGLYGFGFAFAAVVMLIREANTLVDVSSFLVQIFSGSNFPVNALPEFLLPVALALPLTYGLDPSRSFDWYQDDPAPAMGNVSAHRIHGDHALDRNHCVQVA